MLKQLVELRRYLLCGGVAACHGMACVLHAVHSAHHRIINNDVIPPNILNEYNLSQVQCKLPDDGRRPKHVGAIFMCILM